MKRRVVEKGKEWDQLLTSSMRNIHYLVKEYLNRNIEDLKLMCFS